MPIVFMLALLVTLGGCHWQKAPDYSMPTRNVVPEHLLGPMIVSTNEPFFSARVDEKSIQLTGVDHPHPVHFTVIDIKDFHHGRRWTGRNQNDDLVVQILDTPCTDSMSGAQFPLTGIIVTGRMNAEGCARPADMPPPGAGM